MKENSDGVKLIHLKKVAVGGNNNRSITNLQDFKKKIIDENAFNRLTKNDVTGKDIIENTWNPENKFPPNSDHIQFISKLNKNDVTRIRNLPPGCFGECGGPRNCVH